MATLSKIKRVKVPGGGGTSTIDPTDSTDQYTEYLYTGTGDLTSNYTISPGGTLTLPYRVRIIWAATLGLNGNDVTIFGVPLTYEQAFSGAVVVDCLYNLATTSWIVTVLDSSTMAAQPREGVENVALTAGGGAINLDPATDKQVLVLTGNVTLTASWTIQGSGTPKDGASFFVKYKGTITQGVGMTITIFGITLTDPEALAGDCSVIAYYNAAAVAWESQFIAAH